MPLHELFTVYDNQPLIWRVAIVTVAFIVAGVGAGALWGLFAYGMTEVLPVKGWRIRIARRKAVWTNEDVADLMAETEARDKRDRQIFNALMSVSDRRNVVQFPTSRI